MRPDWVQAVRLRRTLMIAAAIATFAVLVMCARMLGELIGVAEGLAAR